MGRCFFPQGYKPRLPLHDTQIAIGLLKRCFEDKLANALQLARVSAPLFVEVGTGLNDDLSGVERPVEFTIKEADKNVQIVHSLAKWKRMALWRYGFEPGFGLYTDMNAIRRDDEIDNLHSIYVDQWDWEKTILPAWRNIDYLKQAVTAIVNAICDTLDFLKCKYPILDRSLTREVKFITSQELLDMYPSLAAKERENAIAKEYKTIFLMKIGGELSNGKPHDGRAPDYDDWLLNGDILFWCDILDCAIEISSMGIRVDAETLDKQLKLANCNNRREFNYHKELLAGKYPLAIGGGIGQSRLSMLLLQKAHIGEVQVSVWDNETLSGCSTVGVEIL